MSKDGNTAAAVIGCVGLIPVTILGTCLRAWAITTLWAWFVTPTWHINAPSGAAALGVSSLLGALVSTSARIDKSESKTVVGAMLTAYATILLNPLGAVAFGWVVKHWM